MPRDDKKPRKGKGKSKKPSKPVEDYEDEWSVEAWIYPTKGGKVYSVSRPGEEEGDESELIGFISAKQLDRLLDGDIKGCPIKLPPADSDEE